MPNGDGPKEYGGHKYPDTDSTHDCEHGCGCCAGPSSSGGPIGLDPISGACPNNPADGELLGGDRDHALVVKQRIRDLSSRAYKAEELLKKVDSDKIELAKGLGSVRRELAEKNLLLGAIKRLLQPEEDASSD